MDIKYRGLLFDDARHFHGKEELKHTLDIMSRLGYNVLHWHISDDQGFRLTLPGYEKLSQHSSYRKSTNVGGYLKNSPTGAAHGGIYTPDDVKEIVDYAGKLGISVMPELDMPGHFSAILSAYPEYTCDGKEFEVPGCFGVLENTLCLGKDEAREFAKELVLAVAKQTGARMMHIGFDEIKSGKMCSCPDCISRAKKLGLKSPKELIPLFRTEVAEFLKENGISVYAWNDASSVTSPDLSVTMIHWRPETNRETAEYINRGQHMIMCDFYHYYADYPYCMTPLKKTYRYNPVIRGINELENVEGFECTLWSEYFSDNGKMRFNGYYRMAAIAEQWRSEGKRPYREFISDLKAHEEELFGERLDIPESILNPGIFTRVFRFVRCMLKDSDYEYKYWLRRKEKQKAWQR